MLLGYLECFIPIPIPGVKLGLANIAVLVALAAHDLPGAFFVGLVKVLATGLLFGNPVTLAYSLTGTLLAFVCMSPLSLLPTMRLWMVSVVGALAHEAGQLMVAHALLGTPLVWYSAPLLAAAGCITGLLCGIAAERTATLILVDDLTGDRTEPPKRDTHQAESSGKGTDTRAQGALRPLLLMASYLLFVVMVMHARTNIALAVSLAVTLAACLAARLRPQVLGATLAPALPIALVTFVAQVASAQQGTPIITLGSLTLSQEALRETLIMAVRLCSITCTSVAVVSLAGRDGLAAGARALLGPLRACGVPTQGPELALATAMTLATAIAESLPKTDRRAFLTSKFWTEELPATTRDLYERASRGN
jgi:heptaprenyl diphosphate synthase